MRTNICLSIIFLCLSAVSASLAWATEGGTNFYQLASRDLRAGIQPLPGFYLREDVTRYHGTRDQTSGQTTAHLDLEYWLSLTRFVGVTPYQILGGTWGMAVAIPVATSELKVSYPGGGKHADKEGRGDITLTPMTLGWHGGQWHAMANLSVYLPTGSYQKSRTLNLGKNRYAVDTGLAVTWLAPLWELSGVAGYTFSTINTETDYRSGDELHLDLTGTDHFPGGWSAGATGYAFYQTTPDNGGGVVNGPNRGEVLALGPILSCSTKIFGHTLIVTTKYLQECAARNRFSGASAWLTLSYAF